MVWKCDEPVGDGTCVVVCHRREKFERHLRDEHGVSEAELDGRQERCRVDRSSNTKYWCGFCKEVRVVDAREKNGAWGERYDHIGNHFTGCNGVPKAEKGEWKFFDMDSSNEDGDEEMEGATGNAGGRGKRKRDDNGGSRRVKKAKGRAKS